MGVVPRHEGLCNPIHPDRHRHSTTGLKSAGPVTLQSLSRVRGAIGELQRVEEEGRIGRLRLRGIEHARIDRVVRSVGAPEVDAE